MRKAMILGLALAGMTTLLPEPAAALRWGGLVKKQSCNQNMKGYPCGDTYEARLWDIPIGTNWGAACYSTPHPQIGIKPFGCSDRGFLGEWGFFSVYNKSCNPACP